MALVSQGHLELIHGRDHVHHNVFALPESCKAVLADSAKGVFYPVFLSEISTTHPFF